MRKYKLDITSSNAFSFHRPREPPKLSSSLQGTPAAVSFPHGGRLSIFAEDNIIDAKHHIIYGFALTSFAEGNKKRRPHGATLFM